MRRDLLFLKVGTGIGCGLILGGRLHRGAQGAAGDIGHVRVADADDVPCRCGNTGCLETVAGGRAAAQAALEGMRPRDGREVVALVTAGDRSAVPLVRQAGRLIGEVLASTVNLLNPALIVWEATSPRRTSSCLPAFARWSTALHALATSRPPDSPAAQLGDRAGIMGRGVW